MTLGKASQQPGLSDPIYRFCGERLPANSIYAFLHAHRERLFPDSLFADLFASVGRRSVPPSVVAAVMVLQRLDGLSDREAVDRFAFDVRWRYAAGVGGWDGASRAGFAHTVLVDMRERLRRSDRPDRIFEVALTTADHAGLLGRRRALDSTPLYDAVATMDTITLIRSAVRGLLTATGRGLTGELRAVLSSGDDYSSTAKPAAKRSRISGAESQYRSKSMPRLLTRLPGPLGGGPVVVALRLVPDYGRQPGKPVVVIGAPVTLVVCSLDLADLAGLRVAFAGPAQDVGRALGEPTLGVEAQPG
jgi:hypothetical protein